MLRAILTCLGAFCLASCQVEPNIEPSTINPYAPSAQFSLTLDANRVRVDASVSTAASASATLNYKWDFNGEHIAYGVQTEYTFNTLGEKYIRLIVNDGRRRSEPTTQFIQVDELATTPTTGQPPVASFSVTVNNKTISLDASQSVDANNDLLSYHWNINNERQLTGKTASYTFTSDGSKTISLTVNDGHLNSEPLTKTVTITSTPANRAPVAAMTIQIDKLTVSVDGQTSTDADGDSLSYAWSFNNEATKVGQTATHTFSSGGEKTITLTVNDGSIDSDTISQTITVTTTPTNHPPIANMTVVVDQLTVTVNGSTSSDSDGDSLTYAWNFNNEETRTFTQGSYTFASGGAKEISLVVFDGKSYSPVLRRSVTVTEPPVNQAPVAEFTVSAMDLTVSVDASLSNDADNDALTYLWTFEPGKTASQKLAEYTYSSAGTKTISLLVNDSKTNSVRVEKSIILTEPEPAYLPQLTAIAPSIAANCLNCHGTTPFGNAKISYRSGTVADIRQGIESYLSTNTNVIDRVKNKPTGGASHTGGAPLSAATPKQQWFAVVEGIALELGLLSPEIEATYFSEDYESMTVGENPTGWGVTSAYVEYSNPSPTQFTTIIRVSDTVAHSGSKSLYVDGRGLNSAMRYSHKKLNITSGKERVFVRYYLRSSEYIGNRALTPTGQLPNHNHFMALENGQQDEIRIGEVKGALGVNEYGRDDIVPKDDYWYGKIATPRLNADTWYCIETAFLNDGAKPELKTWLDDVLVTHIDDHTDFKNGAATQNWLDNKFGKVSFGWANYGTYDTELYFDDIVVSDERIGCM